MISFGVPIFSGPRFALHELSAARLPAPDPVFLSTFSFQGLSSSREM